MTLKSVLTNSPHRHAPLRLEKLNSYAPGVLLFRGGFILKIMETIGTIEEVYSRVMDVIIKNIGSTTEDVEKQILNFM